MRLEKIEIKNYRTIRNRTVDMVPGVIGVLGPNGSGKSSFFSALHFLYTGSPLGDDDKKDVLSWGEKGKGYVRGHFTHENDYYVLTRHLPGTKTTLEGPRDFSELKVPEINQLVLDLVGDLNPAILKSVVFAEQGKMDEVLSGTGAKRLDTLVKVFRLDAGERLREKYQEELASIPVRDVPALEERRRKAMEDMGCCLGEAANHKQAADMGQATLDAILAKGVVQGRPLVEVGKALDAARREYGILVAEEGKIRKALEKGPPTREELDAARDYRRDYRLWEQSVAFNTKAFKEVDTGETLAHWDAERDRCRRLVESLEREITLGTMGKCKTCGTDVPPLTNREVRDKKEMLEQFKRKLLDVSGKRANQELAERWRSDMEAPPPKRPDGNLLEDVAEADLSKIVPLADLEEDLDILASKKATQAETIKELEEEAKDAPTPEALEEYRERSSRIGVLTREISNNRQEAARLLERCDSLKALVDQTSVEIGEAVEGRSRADLLRRCREVLHRENLPRVAAMGIVERISPRMAAYAQGLGVPYPVSFTNNLDVEYDSGDGPKPFKALSGGQKACVAIAFRLAQVDVLAGGLGLVALDEPTAELDEDAVRGLADVIEQVSALAIQRGVTILVSTHSKELGRAFSRREDMAA